MISNCDKIWLKQGDRNAQVGESQKRLQANNFYIGYPIDNYFGPKMAEGVGGAQKKFKLKIDEKIGPVTCKVLNENPKSTTCADNQLKKGCKGANVGILQKWLNDNFINGLKVDDDFGDATEYVLKLFQKEVGLKDDGWVGDVTRAKMATYKKPAPAQDIVSLKSYSLYRQTTGYTCGVASLKMALSVFGIVAGEMWLAGKAGTSSTNGTSAQGMITAVSAVNAAFGSKLRAWSETFDSWTKLQNYISKNTPVALRIKSFLNPRGEHWVLFTALNIKENYALLGDPSYGVRKVDLNDLKTRIKAVSSASIIVISV